DAIVYLGLREDTDPDTMRWALRSAQAGGPTFPADDFVARWPVERHDHVLIPSGTVHCSGAGSMTLEISATPYIFTFKMWDWGRTGLDGLPRPVHLDHAFANIDWSRREAWVARELLHRVEPRGSGPGWRSEVTGLHELEFIETTRHWFTGPVDHDTRGTVHVLNLVHGSEVVVESPGGAAVGPYRITPTAPGEHATLRAHVRGTED
ncbi:MAG: mannose-6-phosphate isomerase, partial [Propionibacteriaceae bacterium]|nr:mannose-6-phosphate isomerase [Propionibacteriaceae bacterium]